MAPDDDGAQSWGAQLARATQALAGRATATAHDEALTLLSAFLGEPPTLVLARPSTAMRATEAEAFAGWVARRLAGEAIPRITGSLAFMGLDLMVAHDSPLVSPAAQRLVEVALECARSRASGETSGERSGELSGAELGAGCGAVALALVTFEPRFARIYAIDPSPDALRVAVANGGRYLVNLVIDWRQGDGLDPVPEPVDMIVCDLAAQSMPSALARLLAQAPAKLRPGGVLLCALEREMEVEVVEALARALRAARIWTTPAHDQWVVAVAQVPRLSSGQTRGAAFESGRGI